MVFGLGLMFLLILILAVVKITEILFAKATPPAQLAQNLRLNSLKTTFKSSLDPILCSIEQEFLAKPHEYSCDAQKIFLLFKSINNTTLLATSEILKDLPSLRHNYPLLVEHLRNQFPVKEEKITYASLYELEQD